MNLRRIRRALVSVSDKSGIEEFARALTRWNVEILSTGGTLQTLREAGIDAKSISEETGFPEILSGRVKTLHPKIHAGILAAAENPDHDRQLQSLDITPIDMVVVNLYPFEQTVARNDVTLSEAIEQIDIGGPTLLRAAAKNFKSRVAVTLPSDYETIVREMDRHDGAISETTRFELAKRAFHHTARYDTAIANHLDTVDNEGRSDLLPEIFSISLAKVEDLRYGENPHQKAALYGNFWSFFKKLHGKELSYNNIVDLESAVQVVEEFAEPTVAIVKHDNPCGVGSGSTLADAYAKALATDPTSAFGGIVAMNRPLDAATAQAIDRVFTEVLVAPDYSPEVLEFLRKKKDRRVVCQTSPLRSKKRFIMATIAGGVLVQTADSSEFNPDSCRVVTQRAPTSEERASMIFGWRVAKHVKSNAIVYARSDRTVGIGAGQMSRVDSSRIAAMKARAAGLDLAGSAVASDAFFPFPDGLLEAVKAGATAVIQPGGSIRDHDVIRAADDHRISMLFTGQRHFRH